MTRGPDRRTLLNLSAAWLFAPCAATARLHAAPWGRGPPVSQDQTVLIYLQRLEPFGFAGAVAASRRGQTLHVSAHGLADRERRRPWGPDTRFDTGSVTKQFTAAGILALVADGRLELEGRLGDHLPAPPDKRDISVHQLLTHTGGLEEGFGGDYDRLTKAEFLDIALGAPLAFAPGAGFSYSNAGYGLLAAILEACAGATIDAFMRNRLFLPLGMGDTGYEVSSGEIARGYVGETPQTFVEQTLAGGGDLWNLIGNGGLHSTLRDLQRWTEAIRGEALLPPPLRDRLFQPHVTATQNYRGSGSDLYYGYGWYVWPEAPGGGRVWHLGGNGVLNCAIRRDLGTGIDLIYASNVSEFHDPAYPAPAIERMLAGDHLALPPLLARSPEAELDRLAGRYDDGSGAWLSLERRGGRMRARPHGQSAFSYINRDFWRTTPRLARLNDRTLDTLQASRDARFKALLRVFPASDTLEDIRVLETAFWARREAALGPFKAVSVVGSRIPSGGAAVETIASAEFERGAAHRVYVWGDDDRLIDIYPLDDAPALDLFLSDDLDLVAFDAAAANELRVSVSRTPDGPHLSVADGDNRPVILRRSV